MNSTNFYNLQELLDRVKLLKNRVELYDNKKKQMLSELNVILEDIDAFNQRKQLIESAKQYYLKVVDKIYMNSIAEMEEFVNYMLSYVFYDEKYRIRLDISNRYNKSITFYLIDEKRGLELPLRKGNGKGIKAATSFILLTYYLIRMKSKYIFLDEAFVNISSSYIERFYNYIKELCHNHGMCIVLITHDPRFMNFADTIYDVKKGVVTKCL